MAVVAVVAAVVAAVVVGVVVAVVVPVVVAGVAVVAVVARAQEKPAGGMRPPHAGLDQRIAQLANA